MDPNGAASAALAVRSRLGAIGVRDALANGMYQILTTGLSGGLLGDRQFEGSPHMKSFRSVRHSLRSSCPLAAAFNHGLLEEIATRYSGGRGKVRDCNRGEGARVTARLGAGSGDP